MLLFVALAVTLAQPVHVIDRYFSMQSLIRKSLGST